MSFDALSSESSSLNGLLESHLVRFGEIVQSASDEELEKELFKLDALVNRVRLNDEVIEGLLDPHTPETTRTQILESLQEGLQRLIDGRQELVRLFEKNRLLHRRSIQSILTARRLIYARQNKGSHYAPEICGYCEGFGHVGKPHCSVCSGERFVLVKQPANACPLCKGTGTATSHEILLYRGDCCTVCGGHGWATDHTRGPDVTARLGQSFRPSALQAY